MGIDVEFLEELRGHFFAIFALKVFASSEHFNRGVRGEQRLSSLRKPD